MDSLAISTSGHGSGDVDSSLKQHLRPQSIISPNNLVTKHLKHSSQNLQYPRGKGLSVKSKYSNIEYMEELMRKKRSD